MKFTLSAVLLATLLGGRPGLAQSDLRKEVEQLKAQLAAHQKQIDELRRLLETHGQPLAVAPASAPHQQMAAKPADTETAEVSQGPTSIRLGGISVTPTGF